MTTENYPAVAALPARRNTAAVAYFIFFWCVPE
jgi:hypothetical protein